MDATIYTGEQLMKSLFLASRMEAEYFHQIAIQAIDTHLKQSREYSPNLGSDSTIDKGRTHAQLRLTPRSRRETA
jgi:hypothetical protein